MDPETTRADEIVKALDPHTSRVVDLQRATRLEASVVNGQHQRVKHRAIGFIERAVNEDLVVVTRRRQRLTLGPGEPLRVDRLSQAPLLVWGPC